MFLFGFNVLVWLLGRVWCLALFEVYFNLPGVFDLFYRCSCFVAVRRCDFRLLFGVCFIRLLVGLYC